MSILKLIKSKKKKEQNEASHFTFIASKPTRKSDSTERERETEREAYILTLITEQMC